jgi:Putative abortive phage resistance protein AbiGi, antitoxin
MKPKSDNLFHFTRNLDRLKSILLDGFKPRYCLEDTRWLGLKWKFIAYPMICFCDIPISRITQHTDFYGDYGLGMSKDWGLTNRLTPVLYAAPGSLTSKIADFLLVLDHEGHPNKKELEKKTIDHLHGLLNLIKPITGQMQVGSELIEKDFYQENEWRYVPLYGRMIFEELFTAEQDRANLEVESSKLTFSPKDIKYIFVKDDSEIPSLVDFINSNFGLYPLNDIKIMTTRILSLPTINRDL